MTRADGIALWPIAIGGSIAIHLGLAATLALVPAYRPPAPFDATISIESLSRALADTVPVTAAASSVATQVLAMAAAEQGRLLAGSRDATVAAQSLPASEAVRPADTSEHKEPVADTVPVPAASASAKPATIPAQSPASAKPAELRGVVAEPTVRQASPASSPTATAMAAAQPAEAAIPAPPGESVPTVLADMPASATPLAMAPGNSQQAASAAAISNATATTAKVAAAVSEPVRTSSTSQLDSIAAAVSSRPAALAGNTKALAPTSSGPASASIAASPAAVATVASPVASSPDSGGAAAVVKASQPAPLTADTPTAALAGQARQATLLSPVEPEIPPTSEEVPDVDARLRAFVAGYRANGDCLLAVVGGHGAAGAELDGFTDQPSEMDRLATTASEEAGVPVTARAFAVSRAQCGTLGFLRGLGDARGPSLSINTDKSTIDSGDVLSGGIVGFTKPFRYLLVVDDEGKVEPVAGLAANEGDTARFSAPMTLTSGPVSTVQLLVAIGSDQRLESIANGERAQADVYFSALLEEIARGGRAVEYGVAPFSVR